MPPRTICSAAMPISRPVSNMEPAFARLGKIPFPLGHWGNEAAEAVCQHAVPAKFCKCGVPGKSANASNNGRASCLVDTSRAVSANVTGNADRETGGRFQSLEHSPEAV